MRFCNASLSTLFSLSSMMAVVLLEKSTTNAFTTFMLPKESSSLSSTFGTKKRTGLQLSMSSNENNTADFVKAPTFNGKLVLPMKIIKTGLRGHKVAAVYAVLNNNYKRGGGEGWEHCEYVGITKDLNAMLQSQYNAHGVEKVAHVRALSFAFPQKLAMQEIADQWRLACSATGATLGNDGDWAKITVTAEELESTTDAVADSEDDVPLNAAAADSKDNVLLDGLIKIDEKRREEILQVIAYDDEDDDDLDDDEDDEFFSMDLSSKTESNESSNDDADVIVSPFSEDTETATQPSAPVVSTGDGPLLFNKESVDQILNEIRPYLISDGGNVSVQRVEEETKNVYLILEGACGSCPSSTVTMQMGITRVLKENFPDLGEVVQVEDGALAGEGNPNELSIEAVQAELKRISPAITAMGGVVEIVNVDPLGVVELQFRGSTKIQQGLELAILGVPLVKHVKFVN